MIELSTFRISLTYLFLGIILFSSISIAQTQVDTKTVRVPSEATLGALHKSQIVAVAPEVLILKKVEEELKQKYKTEIYVPPSIPSLIYTQSQQSLLREARNGFNTRLPTSAEIERDGLPDETAISESEQGDTNKTLGMSVRSLSLGGIAFIGPDDWTIWLNSKRVTADNLPTEAVDLRVYKNFIELRWYDAQTNKIYPVRLRPNQTFNLDAHTFVPG